MILEAQKYFAEHISETEYETLQRFGMDGGLLEQFITNRTNDMDERAWCAKVWAKHFPNHEGRSPFSMCHGDFEVGGGIVIGLYENASLIAKEQLQKITMFHSNFRLSNLADQALTLLEEKQNG